MSMLDTLLDPQRRKKAAEDQEKLKATMGHRVARLPAQRNYLYGVARERMALDQLGSFSELPDSTDDHFLQLRAQLAEGLALQGLFDAAAEIAPEGPAQKEYEERAKAVMRVGEQGCDHPLTREHDGVEEQTQLPVQKIWNGKVEILFTRCLICSAVSAYA